MRYFEAEFIFSKPVDNEMVKNYLIDEFQRRRAIAVDLVNPMYDQWNKEFDRLYPNVDGYSDEYNKFIDEKHKDALEAANKLFELNLIELKSDCKNHGGFYGYCRMLDVTIELILKPVD